MSVFDSVDYRNSTLKEKWNCAFKIEFTKSVKNLFLKIVKIRLKRLKDCHVPAIGKMSGC